MFFADILFRVLLYYILFVQCLWMAPGSKGALINTHYYSVFELGHDFAIIWHLK